ncbi:MAG: elongation factor 1-alpha C-terminal domain-related protein, partial [Bryobacteraceae bacterium]
GHVGVGDPVVIYPSGRTTAIASIVTFDGEADSAEEGQSITLTLADEIDIIRGDVISDAGDPPSIGSTIEATLVWLNEAPAELNKRYRIKHTARQEWAELKDIPYRININSLEQEKASEIQMNEIALVHIETARPLTFDPYSENRAMGSFILVDPVTNATVAAGLISGAVSREIREHASGFSWRIQHGELIISLPAANGFASGSAAGGIVPESGTIGDPETIEALERLLRRLNAGRREEHGR